MPADAVDITPGLLRRWPLPEPAGDKEARGRVLVIGGTAHTPGAVLLAGEAVLRAGAGKLQIATADSVAAAVAVAVPEALVVPMPTSPDGSLAPASGERLLELAQAADAVLVGSGFSDVDATLALMDVLVPALDGPLVLDAVASAFLGEHGGDVHHLDGRCVVSANPGEVAKTLGVDESEVVSDPGAAAGSLAADAGLVVLCGGRTKTVASPEGRLWSSHSGGPGLGVSGSGDVQAGVVAGLLGRGADADQAAVWAAHLHGVAGDELAREVGNVGFLAREIAARVPRLVEDLAPDGLRAHAVGQSVKRRPVRRS